MGEGERFLTGPVCDFAAAQREIRSLAGVDEGGDGSEIESGNRCWLEWKANKGRWWGRLEWRLQVVVDGVVDSESEENAMFVWQA